MIPQDDPPTPYFDAEKGGSGCVWPCGCIQQHGESIECCEKHESGAIKELRQRLADTEAQLLAVREERDTLRKERDDALARVDSSPDTTAVVPQGRTGE